MGNSINESAIKKLKLLITVVDRPKGEFYLDVISQFEVNSQLVVGGLGTAQSELIELLGLNIHKLGCGSTLTCDYHLQIYFKLAQDIQIKLLFGAVNHSKEEL